MFAYLIVLTLYGTPLGQSFFKLIWAQVKHFLNYFMGAGNKTMELIYKMEKVMVVW